MKFLKKLTGDYNSTLYPYKSLSLISKRCNITVKLRTYSCNDLGISLTKTSKVEQKMRILQTIHRADISAFTWFVKYKHRETVVKIARTVSITADGPLYVFAGCVFLYLQHWDLAKLMALSFLLERICYKVFKRLFKRNRPPEAIPGFKSVVEPSDRFSFPSGHTSAAFMVTCIFTYFFPLIGLILIPWALCVGAARVVLGVHFPSDVFAGAAMGYGIFALFVTILF